MIGCVLSTEYVDQENCLPVTSASTRPYLGLTLVAPITIPISSTTSTIAGPCKSTPATEFGASVDKHIAIFERVTLELVEPATQRISISFHIGTWVPVSAGLTVQLVKPVIGKIGTYWLPV